MREGQGIAGQVALTKQPLLVRSRAEAPAPSVGTYRSESFISLPIVVGERTLGVLNLSERADGLPFQDADLETLQLLAGHIAACLVRERLDDQLRQLAELAETDPLTRLYNRGHFDRRLAAEVDRSRRTGDPVGVLLIDVNHFKEINDTLGHVAGDEVMRAVAEVLRRSVRTYDIPVRFGGDEFAVILPETDHATAHRVGDRIVSNTAGAFPQPVLAAVPSVGLSVGVATAPPADDSQALVERADTAMYRAKAAGGGVALWEAEMSETPVPRRARTPLLPAPYLADPGRLANRELQGIVPAPLAEEWNVLVIGREGQVLTVVMPEPSNAAVEALSAATGHAIYPVYSAAADIERARKALAS